MASPRFLLALALLPSLAAAGALPSLALREYAPTPPAHGVTTSPATVAPTVSSAPTAGALLPINDRSGDAKTHYGNPLCGMFGSCYFSDEYPDSVPGISGSFCTSFCNDNHTCPTDVPAGVTATPKCDLADIVSRKGKSCALICSPTTVIKKVADAQCGAHGSCKPFQGTGICTYNDCGPTPPTPGPGSIVWTCIKDPGLLDDDYFTPAPTPRFNYCVKTTYENDPYGFPNVSACVSETGCLNPSTPPPGPSHKNDYIAIAVLLVASNICWTELGGWSGAVEAGGCILTPLSLGGVFCFYATYGFMFAACAWAILVWVPADSKWKVITTFTNLTFSVGARWTPFSRVLTQELPEEEGNTAPPRTYAQCEPKLHCDTLVRKFRIPDNLPLAPGLKEPLLTASAGSAAAVETGSVPGTVGGSSLPVINVGGINYANVPVCLRFCGIKVYKTHDLYVQKYKIKWWQYVLHKHHISSVVFFFPRDPFDMPARMLHLTFELALQFGMMQGQAVYVCGTGTTFTQCKQQTKGHVYLACYYALGLLVVPRVSKIIMWARKTTCYMPGDASGFGGLWFTLFWAAGYGILVALERIIRCGNFCLPAYPDGHKYRLGLAGSVVTCITTISFFATVWLLAPSNLGDTLFFAHIVLLAFAKEAVKLMLSFFITVATPISSVSFGGGVTKDLRELSDDSTYFGMSSKKSWESVVLAKLEHDRHNSFFCWTGEERFPLMLWLYVAVITTAYVWYLAKYQNLFN
jgi:hypothetical protein